MDPDDNDWRDEAEDDFDGCEDDPALPIPF